MSIESNQFCPIKFNVRFAESSTSCVLPWIVSLYSIMHRPFFRSRFFFSIRPRRSELGNWHLFFAFIHLRQIQVDSFKSIYANFNYNFILSKITPRSAIIRKYINKTEKRIWHIIRLHFHLEWTFLRKELISVQITPLTWAYGQQRQNRKLKHTSNHSCYRI